MGICVRQVTHTSKFTHLQSTCVCVCMHVRACADDSVSVKVLCFSVCQFHFALHD